MTLPPAEPRVGTVGSPVALPELPTGVLLGLDALGGVSPLLVAAAVTLLTAVAVEAGAFLGRRRATARIQDGAVGGGGTGDAGVE